MPPTKNEIDHPEYRLTGGPKWLVYVLRSRCGRYYTGITNDLARRMFEHNAGKSFATRGKHWDVYFVVIDVSQEEAARIERYLKTGDTRNKRDWISNRCVYAIERNTPYTWYLGKRSIRGRTILDYLDTRSAAKKAIEKAMELEER